MSTDPQTFRHRSEEIEAVQWTGDNADALRAFAGPDFDEIDLDDRTEDPDETAAVRESEHGTWRGLKPGDWVVRLDGGLYEFAADDFAKQYEPAPAAPVAAPPTGQAGLRGRIIEALSEARRPGLGAMSEADAVAYMADAVLSVLPAPVDRAAWWREAADECDEAGAAYTARALNDHAAGAFALMEAFLRKANEAEYAATPCDFAACDPGGEPCSVHERLMGHAEGDHELCAPDCGTPAAETPGPETQPVRHAPGTAILCPDCRAKGHSVCMADEAQQPKTQAPTEIECANCWRVVENRSVPNMGGPSRDNWVHVPGGFQPCFPQRGADSPRAEPELTVVPQPEIVHACPPDGSGLTPCCGRTPFELPLSDRISSEAPVTCTTAPAAVAEPGKEG